MITSQQNPDRNFKGIFIAVEGEDGAGKTTAIEILVEELQKLYADRQIHTFRAPGGTEFGEHMRTALLSTSCQPESEVMAFLASHNETIHQVIFPRLEKGWLVVTDRFIDSCYAYQGYGRQQFPLVAQLHKSVLGGVQPDHTIYITAHPHVKKMRLEARTGKADRLDNESAAFKERVENGMRLQREARIFENPYCASVIENNGSLELLRAQIQEWVKTRPIVFPGQESEESNS